MHKLLTLTGSIAGALGVVICAASGMARMMGLFYIADYQSTTIFTVGVGIMVFACFLKLEALLLQSQGN